MRTGEIVVLSQSPLMLSERNKKLLCEKWEMDLISLGVSSPKRFSELVRYIISHCDSQGVLFGSIEDLAQKVNMSRQEVRKVLHVLERANLLKRKNGITIITDKRLKAHYL